MEPYAYEGGPFDVSVVRVDDRVVIYIYRDGQLIVELTTTRKGAVGLIQKMLGALA